jgi:hypothetical protein
MAVFEVISTALSIIIGLGMGHLLWTGSAAFRSRKEIKLHWIPIGWALCIFLQHANFLISALAIDREIEVWTYSLYLQLLLQAVLLFVSGALILPSESRLATDLMQDFRDHGRFGLIAFAAYQALWVSTNYRADPSLLRWDSVLRPGQAANLLLIGLLLVAFFVRNARVQVAAVSLSIATLVFAMTFLWSQNVL